jgi:hypothetical protein
MSNERYILKTQGTTQNLLHSHTCCDQSEPTISFDLAQQESIETVKVQVKCNKTGEPAADAPVVDGKFHTVGNVKDGFFVGVNYKADNADSSPALNELLDNDGEGSLSRLQTSFDKQSENNAATAAPYANNPEGSLSRLQTEHDAV